MSDTITLPRKHIDYAAHALEHFNKDAPDQLVSEIIHHLRTALAAEPTKQEPVAVFDEQMGHPVLLLGSPMLKDKQPLYTAPPEDEALRRDAEKWRKAQAKYIAWQKGGKAEAMEGT